MSSASPPDPVGLDARCVSTDVGPLWLPAQDQVLLPYMQETGCWEPAESALLRSLLTPTSRFLDVGAHVGYFSLLAAQIIRAGSIDAVEPDPANFQLLRLNLWQGAPTAQTWGVALGRERKIVALASEAHNSGNTQVLANVPSQAQALASATTGDSLFAGRKFDVMKIDVQGQEGDVLLGFSAMLAQSPNLHIVAEFFPAALSSMGVAPGDTLSIYRKLGLSWRVCVGDKILPLDQEQLLSLCANAGPSGFVNLLLTRAA